MSLLAYKSQWKGDNWTLVNRVRGLVSLSKFSIREFKALRKILRKDYKDKEVDYDKLIFEFPGKSMQALVTA